MDFLGDAVFVAHNAAFDLGFVRAALARADRTEYRPTVVDTAALARRLLRDEVPNCKLSTLASRLRLDHTPNHRALDDALRWQKNRLIRKEVHNLVFDEGASMRPRLPQPRKKSPWLLIL